MAWIKSSANFKPRSFKLYPYLNTYNLYNITWRMEHELSEYTLVKAFLKFYIQHFDLEHTIHRDDRHLKASATI